MRVAAWAGVLVLGWTAAGCGSDSDGGGGGGDASDAFVKQSAEKIIDQTLGDMGELKSLHIEGTVVDDQDEISLDLSIASDGDCAGTVGVQGGTAEIIVVGGEQYMKGDEKFWTASLDAQRGPQIDKLIGDRYVLLPPDATDFSSFCDLDEFLSELERDEDDTFTKGEEGEVDGEAAIAILSDEEDGKSRAWIATEGKHVLLKIESIEGDEGSFTFSAFDEPVGAEKPPAREIADLQNLS